MCTGPQNRFQEMNSASLCSLAGRYDNPLPPRFLAPIDFLEIQAQGSEVLPVIGPSGRKADNMRDRDHG
jgi:hypothetical protein